MMRKIYALFLLLTASSVIAQQSTKDESAPKTFSAVPQIRLYGFYPIHFGDQQFADAYRANPGFGFSISPVRYKNWRFVAGFERTTYRVENHTIVAQPVDVSSYQSLFGAISYGIGSENHGICIKPTVGIGGSRMYLKVGSQRFGEQSALDARAGLTADWAAAKHLSVFLTANYVHSNIDVDTAEEWHDFYAKANSVQVGFGLMIR